MAQINVARIPAGTVPDPGATVKRFKRVMVQGVLKRVVFDRPKYEEIQTDITRFGLPGFPKNVADMTKADVRKAIAVAIGIRLKAEIITDPNGLDYAGMADDAAIAAAINSRPIKTVGWKRASNLLVVTAVNGNVLTMEAENGAPLQLSNAGVGVTLQLVFFPGVPTGVLETQGPFELVSWTDITLTLAGPLPAAAPTAQDLCFLTRLTRMRLKTAPAARVLRGIPYGTIGITADDVTRAKV